MKGNWMQSLVDESTKNTVEIQIKHVIKHKTWTEEIELIKIENKGTISFMLGFENNILHCTIYVPSEPNLLIPDPKTGDIYTHPTLEPNEVISKRPTRLSELYPQGSIVNDIIKHIRTRDYIYTNFYSVEEEYEGDFVCKWLEQNYNKNNYIKGAFVNEFEVKLCEII